MDKFLSEYNGKSIEDDITVNSAEMASFYKKFKNYLKRVLPEFDLCNFSMGHYEVSGFLEKDGKYLYISYDVPRFGGMIDTKDHSVMHGVLIRTAENAEDYHGGGNHFCSLSDIADTAKLMI